MTEANVPAFPVVDSTDGQLYGGLTKREYFAAMALQGLLANPSIVDSISRMVETGKYSEAFGKEAIPDMAIQSSDKLIELLNKQTNAGQ